MSKQPIALLKNERLDHHQEIRKQDDIDWRMTDYRAWIEYIFKNNIVIGTIDKNSQISIRRTGTSGTAILISQQPIEIAHTVSDYFKIKIYSNYDWFSAGEWLSSRQSPPRMHFPRVDIKPINVFQKSKTLSAETAKLEIEFSKLVAQWKDETFYHSSLAKIFAHPAYQRIIAMGTAGLPLVLRELRDNPDRWFYALKFITGDAGKGVDDGMNAEDARAAWLEWGYKNNYI